MKALRVLAACLLLVAGQAPSAGAAVSREYQLKAAFLYNFTRFTEWPPASLPKGTSPIVVGVLGRNPFGDELARIARESSVNGHPVEVATFTTAEEAAQRAHLLFVGGRDEAELAAITRALAERPVLTVGESPAFAEAGGIISLAVANDRITFSINIGAAERAGLRISAQLQKLATAVSHR